MTHGIRSRAWLWAMVAIIGLLLPGCSDDDNGITPPGDTTPPAVVDDLNATAQGHAQIQLEWTAPGDDGMSGQASQYDIRYSTTPLDEGGWGSADPVADPPTPKIAGTGEVFTVGGLSPGTRYYFGLKTADEVPNWSGLSNVAMATTESLEEPVLVVSPSSLAFGTDQTQLTFSITNGGTGTLSWTITDNQPWLSVSPTSGTTTTDTDVITVTVDRTGLSPSNYSGTVTVTPNVGSAQQVAVTMTVEAAPVLVVSPISLAFGTDQTQLTFSITNGGTGTLSWTIADDQPWMSVSPTSGTTTTDTDVITVTVDRTGLSPADYSGTVTVTPDVGSAQQVGVTMTVEAAPVLVVSPISLAFGTDQTQLTFSITNGGTGSLSWTITDDQPWLSVSPTSGTTTTETDVITVTVDRTGLSPSNYSGTVTVTPNAGSAHQVGVTMVVPPRLVRIEPGTFTMGSPTDEPERIDNETQHQVTLTKTFYMGVHQVTEELWDAVMGSGNSTSQLPKVNVTWLQAVAFCNALSDRDGYARAYTINGSTVTWNQDANGYRLPTEAEWEYACRAGTEAAFNNDTNCLSADTEANYDGRYHMQGCPSGIYRGVRTAVGSFAPNAWGLYDMHGNVWEWCWDSANSPLPDYGAGSRQDPTGDPSGSNRVLRGGSWDNYERRCRSAYRGQHPPGGRGYNLGIRLSRTVQ